MVVIGRVELMEMEARVDKRTKTVLGTTTNLTIMQVMLSVEPRLRASSHTAQQT